MGLGERRQANRQRGCRQAGRQGGREAGRQAGKQGGGEGGRLCTDVQIFLRHKPAMSVYGCGHGEIKAHCAFIIPAFMSHKPQLFC